MADASAGASAAASRRASVVAITGLVCLAVSLGIGRFAFTPLLPMMLHDGTVNLAQGGALATANYAGYLAGSLLGLVWRTDSSRAARYALVLTVLLTVAMALPGSFALWMTWRALAGMASALVMIHATAWCMQRLTALGRPTWIGLMFCGTGIGIVLTGMPAFAMTAMGWSAREGWALFAAVGAVLVAAIWRLLTPLPASAAARRGDASPAPWPATQTIGLSAAYGLAGFGYIITATFLPVIARQTMPGSVWADLFWPLFGIGVTIGAALVTRIGSPRDNWRLLAALYLMQAAGVGSAAAWQSAFGLALSSVLVGLPFTALIALSMREAHHLAGPRAPKLISLMTALYALGQIAGPPLAAATVARTGSFGGSLGIAAGALTVGGMICLAMRRRKRGRASGVRVEGGIGQLDLLKDKAGVRGWLHTGRKCGEEAR
ncbi:YbfB/YjiJ family MFS transporter [Cupriavidus plantarum]|uniref:YbfB/YjiJ family MFS transporter n=2 Tax=Cupriavidus plantarum TaxID=942865 RepID=UPI00339D898F